MKKSLLYISIFSCILLLITTVTSLAQDMGYGLAFNSFEVVQEKRTGLDLSPSKDFSFPNGFSLSFDLFFQSNPEYNFGDIFRIIGQNNHHIDFLVTPEKLTVVNTEDKILAECLLEETSNHFSSSFPFQLNLDIKNNSLKITIGEKVFSPQVSSLEYFKEVNIFFGKCDHPSFQTSDVPKMILKDIHINDIQGNAVYYWKLLKHTEDGVYDELKNYFAKVENPQWLLDKHVFWHKRISFTTLKNPQIAYNPDKNVIAIADRKRFFIYNTLSNTLSQNDNSSGFVHSNDPNQMIYNPSDSTYYSYCFSNLEGGDVASYNFSNKSWSNTQIVESDFQYGHHNRYVSPEEDCLYLFGGYGQHLYKNTVNKYSFKTGKWEKLQYRGDVIYPRYLSGLGVIDEHKLLLFGGYGSSSGLQVLSPRNYYDLYQINLPDLMVKKIWEMTPPKDPFVVSNSMVVDTLNKCFYALCFPQNQYNTFLSFVKFSLQNPGYEIVSDSIPFSFNDKSSYVDLFQNKEMMELYAITFSSLTTDSLATVSIYSLFYPNNGLSVYQNVAYKPHHNGLFVGLILLLLILAWIVLFFLFFRKKKIDTITATATNTEIEVDSGTEEIKDFPDDKFTLIKQAGDRDKKQALFLFGGFQVKDKNGNDITGEFSPTLKQLFLIILLNTLKDDGKGISSVELDDTLWPNKTRESARNNRSVMISRLRQLFENIGSLHIESFNSYWRIKLGDEIYCDYREALTLLQNMENKNNRTKEEVMKLINMVSYGELLPNLQVEWLDPFKANFANLLIDLLINVSKQKELAFSPFEIIYLADTLLIYDILNDDALKLKCSALVKMGKNGLAREIYNSFVKQYLVLFGTGYNYSFAQVIS